MIFMENLSKDSGLLKKCTLLFEPLTYSANDVSDFLDSANNVSYGLYSLIKEPRIRVSLYNVVFDFAGQVDRSFLIRYKIRDETGETEFYCGQDVHEALESMGACNKSLIYSTVITHFKKDDANFLYFFQKDKPPNGRRRKVRNRLFDFDLDFNLLPSPAH